MATPLNPPGDQAIQLACALIRTFEGLRLDAYPDPATGGAPWTIGYGMTGPTIQPGDTISAADAESLLQRRVAADLPDILNLLDPQVLLPRQLAALLSFCYNEGFGKLKYSTLYKRLRAGEASTASKDEDGVWQFTGPATEFAKWNLAGGHIMKGLTRRRLAEALLFCGESYAGV